jgi:hypothetical protein
VEVLLPGLNISSEAELGQSMVSKAKSIVVPAIKIEGDVSHTGINMGMEFILTIPGGELLESGKDPEGTFYQSLKSVTIRNANGTYFYAKGGIFVPTAANKSTEVYWIVISGSARPLTFIHPGIAYKNTKFQQWSQDSLKRELVYSGISQNTVSILYREFINDMARPAFSQDLKYDLSQGSTIGYRGARFEVIKASNLNIQYKVLKTLD